ncbi:O-antigen/teichoic acid export membrane protein [Bradyrhizobium sp. GM6.1]
MLVSIAQALTIQGPVVIIGLIGTPMQVVIFSTSRTLARLGASAMNMANFALTPEYSRLFGMGRFQQFGRMIRIHMAGAVAVTIAYIAVLNVGGDMLLAIWTHQRVAAEQPFLLVLLLTVAFEMFWRAQR